MITRRARFELYNALDLLARASHEASRVHKKDEPTSDDHARLMGFGAYSALINDQISRAQAREELTRVANVNPADLPGIVLVPRFESTGKDIKIREEVIDMFIGGSKHSHFSQTDTDMIKLISYGLKIMTNHAETNRICNWLIRHCDLFDTDEQIEAIIQIEQIP